VVRFSPASKDRYMKILFVPEWSPCAMLPAKITSRIRTKYIQTHEKYLKFACTQKPHLAQSDDTGTARNSA
jgi:hypothetical protein